jgi:hypothetical protein
MSDLGAQGPRATGWTTPDNGGPDWFSDILRATDPNEAVLRRLLKELIMLDTMLDIDIDALDAHIEEMKSILKDGLLGLSLWSASAWPVTTPRTRRPRCSTS